MTTSRQELDPIFKQALTDFLAPFPVTVQTEVEVSRLPRTIDMLVMAETETTQAQLREKTLLRDARRHNQIEFKGKNDALNIKGYARILGRTYLYIGDNDQIKSLDEMSVTIVCAGEPRTVLRDQAERFTQISEGIFQKEDKPLITIIVINQLPITLEHYPLLIFASSKRKFTQFFTQLLDQLGTDPAKNPYLHLAYIVRPDVTKEFIMPVYHRLPEKNVKIIANDLGDRLIKYIPDEIVWKRITPDQMLDRISPDQMLDRISPDQMLDRISSDQIVSKLDFGEIAALMEKKRWQMIQDTDSAKERIAIITGMPDADRAIVLTLDNRAKLVTGLDQHEQELFVQWVNTENA